MIFNNSTLLSYSHLPIFFGDNGFNYAIEKKIQIQGLLLDLENTNGVSGIFSGVNDLINLSKKTDNLVINGYNLGSGYINNLNIEGGKWVRTAKYTADIIIRSSGNLYNISGDFFTGFNNFKNTNLKAIESIDENFKINLNQQNIYEYDHSLSMKIDPAFEQKGASHLARYIASGLLDKEVPFYLMSGSGGFYNLYKNRSESYDLINKTFSFNENFQKSAEADKNADVYYIYELSRNDQGITEVKETANIIGLLSNNKFNGARTKLQEISGSSFNRCQSTYSNYDIGSLKQTPVSQGFRANKFNGEILFESVFTNDKFFENRYRWEITADINLSNSREALSNISLNIIGHGEKFTDFKYENMKYGLNQKLPLLYDIVYDYYYDYVYKNTQCAKAVSNSLYLKNKNISVSKANGTIDYTFIYTDKVMNSGTANGRKYTQQESSQNITYPVRLFDEYKISNKLIRQFHDQTSFLEESEVIVRKYDKDVILDFFPNDIHNNYAVGDKIRKTATISINPFSRLAQYSTTLISN